MSWKTTPPLLGRSRLASSQHRVDIDDMLRVEGPMSLVCGACGALGKYNVGTVQLNPEIATPTNDAAIHEAVGFSAYFRCRKCDAGGPWKMPPATSARVLAMAFVALNGEEDGPLIFACAGTFDGYTFRYATEGEAHLKGLIEREPDRAFLWVRLGNLYNHAEEKKLAETAYERAIELDPTDIEAHFMFGQLLIEIDRPLDSVPHFHAVLKHSRDASEVPKELRRNMVREAIRSLLEAHAESNGQIDLLPTLGPDGMDNGRRDEPAVIEIREIDLSSDEDIEDLRDMFLGEPVQTGRSVFRRPSKRRLRSFGDNLATPIRREALAVPRNAKCPCGSGHKYKKCCGRSPGGNAAPSASTFP